MHGVQREQVAARLQRLGESLSGGTRGEPADPPESREGSRAGAPGPACTCGRPPALPRDSVPRQSRGRRRMTPPVAVGAVGAVVLLCLLVLARGALLEGPDLLAVGPPEPQGPTAGANPLPPVVPDVTSPALTPSGTVASSSPRAGGSVELLVHVVGQVRRPGVVGLPPGARVRDAVAAAGGARPAAEVSRVNLARVVVDGEQIVVPGRGRAAAALPQAPAAGTQAAGGLPSTGGTQGPGGSPVNLNAASAAQLDSLPGIGPVLAGRILEWRTAHGRFTRVEELAEIRGIGEHLLRQLRPLVTT